MCERLDASRGIDHWRSVPTGVERRRLPFRGRRRANTRPRPRAWESRSALPPTGACSCQLARRLAAGGSGRHPAARSDREPSAPRHLSPRPQLAGQPVKLRGHLAKGIAELAQARTATTAVPVLRSTPEVSRTPDLQVRSLRTVVTQPISSHSNPVTPGVSKRQSTTSAGMEWVRRGHSSGTVDIRSGKPSQIATGTVRLLPRGSATRGVREYRTPGTRASRARCRPGDSPPKSAGGAYLRFLPPLERL